MQRDQRVKQKCCDGFDVRRPLVTESQVPPKLVHDGAIHEAGIFVLTASSQNVIVSKERLAQLSVVVQSVSQKGTRVTNLAAHVEEFGAAVPIKLNVCVDRIPVHDKSIPHPCRIVFAQFRREGVEDFLVFALDVHCAMSRDQIHHIQVFQVDYFRARTCIVAARWTRMDAVEGFLNELQVV